MNAWKLSAVAGKSSSSNGVWLRTGLRLMDLSCGFDSLK
jgi:hypothetical protein